MNYLELIIPVSKFNKLKNVYDLISEDIIDCKGKIVTDYYEFNDFIGDITKNIHWTWAKCPSSLNIFEQFLERYKIMIDTHFKNTFFVKGCSFITLFEKEVLDINCDFHYDITSHYDEPDECNALTIVFPLYFEEGMGNLEFKENEETKVFNYMKNKMIIWDSCKFKHRTQPYVLKKKMKRVLVSINLVSKKEWAVKNMEKSLKMQGNLSN